MRVVRLLDRFLITTLTLVALVLSIVWLRSQIVGDRYRWVELIELPDGGGLVLRTGDVITGEGGVYVSSQRHEAIDPVAEQALRRRAERRARWGLGLTRIDVPTYPVRSGDGVFGPLGISFNREQSRDFEGRIQRSTFSIGLPLWMLIFAAAAYPMLRFVLGVIRRERQERIILGLCPRCGVDVRSGPTRCPCCGKRQPLLVPQRLAA